MIEQSDATIPAQREPLPPTISIVPAGRRPPDAPLVRREGLSTGLDARTSRRFFMKAVGGGLTAVALGAMKVFPDARVAFADGYDVYTTCPSYASLHDCSPGCGPSTVCADCCDEGIWHSPDYPYALRPNECIGGWADAWIWSYGAACGGCYYISYRCHDGWKWVGYWLPTICRATVDCG